MAFLLLFSALLSAEDPGDSVGPTNIRFYTGNASVNYFRNYWDPGIAYEEGLSDELIDLIKRNGSTAMCDYLAWCRAEEEPGEWDWSYYRANAERLDEAGLDYNVFCWLHFPPRWYQESEAFVPYENMETGETIEQISLWSPDLERVFDRFYASLAENLGEHIDFLRLAMPTEYGEMGYCSGMTDWLRPQPHAGPGYWCGDPHARADFRARMLARHGGLEALNRAWGTPFEDEAAITMPDPDLVEAYAEAPQGRRRWADFADWYNEAWLRTMVEVTGIVRRHFPKKEIIVSLGYASERLCYGNDQGRYVAGMERLGVAAQTPGDVGFLATRRVSSACRHYGVPYFTEPPGNVPPERQLNRIFMDISNGVQTWFDYPPNFPGARQHFRKYMKYMTGAPPLGKTAVWLPTLDHWFQPGSAWTDALDKLSDPLRDAMAYEVVDDGMIRSGALDSLGLRHLVLAGASWLDREAWEAVHDWVKRGGILLVLQAKPLSDIEGRGDLWRAQQPEAPLSAAAARELHLAAWDGAYMLRTCAPAHGGLLDGEWFQSEPNGQRWCAPGAGMYLPMKPGKTHHLRVMAQVPPGAAEVEVLLDGKPLGTIVPGQSEPLAARAERDPDASPQARLVFATSGWRPSEVSDSPDSRHLGAYVHGVAVGLGELPEDNGVLPSPPRAAAVWNTGPLWESAKRHGKGGFLALNPAGVSSGALAELVAKLCYESAELTGEPAWQEPADDGQADGVLATRFEDKVLYYNTTDTIVSTHPPGLEKTLDLAPRTIVSVEP